MSGPWKLRPCFGFSTTAGPLWLRWVTLPYTGCTSWAESRLLADDWLYVTYNFFPFDHAQLHWYFIGGFVYNIFSSVNKTRLVAFWYRNYGWTQLL